MQGLPLVAGPTLLQGLRGLKRAAGPHALLQGPAADPPALGLKAAAGPRLRGLAAAAGSAVLPALARHSKEGADRGLRGPRGLPSVGNERFDGDSAAASDCFALPQGPWRGEKSLRINGGGFATCGRTGHWHVGHRAALRHARRGCGSAGQWCGRGRALPSDGCSTFTVLCQEGNGIRATSQTCPLHPQPNGRTTNPPYPSAEDSLLKPQTRVQNKLQELGSPAQLPLNSQGLLPLSERGQWPCYAQVLRLPLGVLCQRRQAPHKRVGEGKEGDGIPNILPCRQLHGQTARHRALDGTEAHCSLACASIRALYSLQNHTMLSPD